MRRTPSPAKKATAKKAKPRDEIPAAVRAVVLARCGGRCEACGESLAEGPVHMHHRRKRNGRNHTPDNLVALHSTCHVVAPEAVHQRPEWARERGLIVFSGGDPTATPLTLPDGRRVLLDPVEPIYRPVEALPYAV
jgi:HNH endonuclease